MERVENLARILDVHETFSRDSRGYHNWLSIPQLFGDERLFDRHATQDAAQDATDAIIRYYVLDQSNPNSIHACLRMARENARALRPLISTEMWVQINMFYNRIASLRPDGLAEEHLPRLCTWVKESCQTHTGILEGTFYRDEGWVVYQVGKYLERADQTTRLLDVKYHLLLPSPSDVGSPLDVSQWNALLRSAAGYHAYRRVQPAGMSPSKVTGFLLFNDRFPRSVRTCVNEIDDRLHQLKTQYGINTTAATEQQVDALRVTLADETIESVIAGGLHEFIDRIQLDLIAVNNELAEGFFGMAAA